MRYPLCISASLLSVIFLAGCQSSAVKTDRSSDSVMINAQGLSSLPESAQIDISFRSGDTIVKNEQLTGVNRLPFRYELPRFDVIKGSSMDVQVRLSGGDVLLSAQRSLPFQMKGEIQLNAVNGYALANTYWQASDISGRGIPPTITTTLGFNGKGKLSGHAGCNHYRTEYQSLGAFIEIDKPQLTRQICSSPVMYHESRYLMLLSGVEYYSIDKDGRLLMFVEDKEKPLVFTPTTRKAVQLTMHAF